jgi:transposase-like protein
MRYPASEKAEIIQLVEQSHLPAKRTLDKLGIPRATFYRWYDRYRGGGIEALARPSVEAGPGRAASRSERFPKIISLSVCIAARIFG